MLFLLSPAKSLDTSSPLADLPCTQPRWTDQAQLLIDQLRQQSGAQIAELMQLSPALAELNRARYAGWTARHHQRNARPALLTFNGDVYAGLQAHSLSPAELQWAQQHLAILSGLYGLLRPLDLLQPYRLEMGTRLATDRGQNLYQFWGNRIAAELNTQLSADSSPVLVNLASQEYFKAVDRKTLQARVLDCVFEDYKGGSYKIISFHAKRARGLMARYAITERIHSPHGLTQFNSEGYAYAPQVSSRERLVFRRGP